MQDCLSLFGGSIIFLPIRALNYAFLPVHWQKKINQNNQYVVFCLVDFRAFSLLSLGTQVVMFQPQTSSELRAGS